ncbi:MAG TPA: hypothetical protein VIN61_06135 [Gammaproteobacteria bacterium]
MDRSSDVRLDSASGRGTDIDLEGQLGLERSKSVARLGGYFWFNSRHRMDFSLYDLSRDGVVPIQETIRFGRRVFEIDTRIESEADFTVLKGDYTFAPLSKPRGFLGVSAGLYVARTKYALREPTLGVTESEDLTAPLPVLGLRGNFRANDRITLEGAAQWFRWDSEDVDGRLHDVYIGADYRFSRRGAVGLAYNDVSSTLRATEPGGFQGELGFGYDGWLVYFKFEFPRPDTAR